MGVSRARRLAMTAADEAAAHAGTDRGRDAAMLVVGLGLLELAHQAKRLADLTPIYGPPPGWTAEPEEPE